jgi:dihydrolipoamide dehydrogenase
MSAVEVKVPDIGDFKDVPVIEIFVKAGDTVAAEDSLVTLESDKATMDVPSPSAGTVKSVSVKVGDRVSEGSLIVVLESAEADARKTSAPAGATPEKPHDAAPPEKPRNAAAASSAPPAAAAMPPAPKPGAVSAAQPASSYTGSVDIECEMLVLGSGPGGYSAAFRSADLGMKTVLVERYATLGGVCLNVGCIPSKALLHIAAVTDETRSLAEHGVTFGAPQFDLDKLRAWKNKVVGKLTGGLTAMAKARKVEVVRGYGKFVDANHVEVEMTDGSGQNKTGARKVVRFAKAIIAAGSQSLQLPFVPQDPRIFDSTGALELPSIPKRMLVVGGGIIGLEMGTVYSTLGTRLDVVEMLDGMMLGADRDLVKVWEKMNKPRFDRVMLKTKTVAMEAKPDAVYVRFEGEQAPSGPQAVRRGADVSRTQPQRQEDRRRERRRGGDRPRLHRGRQPDADECRAYLRDRRHRRPADARTQGDARRSRRRRGCRRREVVLRCARDPLGRVHGS